MDGNICMGAFHDCNEPAKDVKENENKLPFKAECSSSSLTDLK